MVEFLCLTTPTLIRLGDESRRERIAAKSQGLLGGTLDAWERIDPFWTKSACRQLQNAWEYQTRLRWWGPVKQLLTDDDSFAQELRSYYRSSGRETRSFRPPNDVLPLLSWLQRIDPSTIELQSDYDPTYEDMIDGVDPVPTKRWRNDGGVHRWEAP
jgi:hypothetical protein